MTKGFRVGPYVLMDEERIEKIVWLRILILRLCDREVGFAWKVISEVVEAFDTSLVEFFYENKEIGVEIDYMESTADKGVLWICDPSGSGIEFTDLPLDNMGEFIDALERAAEIMHKCWLR